ncbi:hypothetical protein SY83_08810 [Paenibacillus swuensis]|uniref:Adenosylcobinamide amidohydrolase n=1 Tax=Paenibacillus swuensis TaxID=1178515 RepID=A0A172TP42_9BACL|nr:adenosylcobinamide amidohydrolase [Paenibacillus swuensis]ANE48808.1 hypothetical protein SY83_08810 [Paenibacillus swuensis]
MTQPFRGSKEYKSLLFPHWQCRLAEEGDHMLFKAPFTMDVVSSAPFGGGRRTADHLINWKVPLSYDCSDPEAMMRRQLVFWGYPSERCVGLQTAAHLTHASFAEEEGDGYKLLVCSTAGTSNGARAGVARTTFPAYRAGTINTFILLEGRLSDAAMINAVITATEAKTAALQELNILDRENGLQATGTTTDAIAVAVTQTGPSELTHQYAGVATTWGNAVGRLVYATVHEAVRTQKED